MEPIKRVVQTGGIDNLKDEDKWEEFIHDDIKNYLVPNKTGGWFLCCYSHLQTYVTGCRPKFNIYAYHFYNVFADMVNNDEFDFNEALLLSYSTDWIEPTLSK